jgi:TolB-like protein
MRSRPAPRTAAGTRHAARPTIALLALAAALSPLARAGAQQPTSAQPSDSRPTVAVMYFTNGALVNNAEWAPLSKGMAEMMIAGLARNPAIRVVERDRLQQLLEEQNLGSGDRVDKETAIKLGKILGAHHLLMGAFVIDPKQNMRIDVRSVNTETSQIEYVETIQGKADELLDLVDKLGTRVNAGLKLPALASNARPLGLNAPSGPGQLRAMMLVSRALEQQDRGNKQEAITLYKSALALYPDFEQAKVRLASLERTTG